MNQNNIICVEATSKIKSDISKFGLDRCFIKWGFAAIAASVTLRVFDNIYNRILIKETYKEENDE